MSPHASLSDSVERGLRQTVRVPRDSDGVGSALRQIFSGATTLPSDFNALLSRLNKED